RRLRCPFSTCRCARQNRWRVPVADIAIWEGRPGIRRAPKEMRMAQDEAKPAGPDLEQGIALAELADGGTLLGHVGDEEVLLVRRGSEVFAVGAHCTHYHGPLADGLVVDGTVRCPWHHACFDLATGEALHAPALSPLACWSVEQRDGRIFVRGKRPDAQP